MPSITIYLSYIQFLTILDYTLIINSKLHLWKCNVYQMYVKRVRQQELHRVDTASVQHNAIQCRITAINTSLHICKSESCWFTSLLIVELLSQIALSLRYTHCTHSKGAYKMYNQHLILLVTLYLMPPCLAFISSI